VTTSPRLVYTPSPDDPANYLLPIRSEVTFRESFYPQLDGIHGRSRSSPHVLCNTCRGVHLIRAADLSVVA